MLALARILIGIALSAAPVIGVITTALETGPAPGNAPSTIILHGADPRWVVDIGADLERFDRAGLHAVSVDVHVWDGQRTDKCRGFAGLFTPTQPRRVDLCLDFHDSDLGTHLRHKVILHELAHAWIHEHTSEGDREGFTVLRGTEGWNDPLAAHHTRGTEVAANTVMTMLHPDEPTSIEHLCGYELLTGGESVGGRADPCGAHALQIHGPAAPDRPVPDGRQASERHVDHDRSADRA